jgi:Tfp pilus assembly protein PilF
MARQARLAPGRADSLKRAEQYYRAALAQDVANAEIMLRLGRVLSGQGRCDEALRMLAVPEASEGTAYLALLFTADAHRCLGGVADAARAYERAARRCPACSTPRLGLALLSLPTEDGARAAAYAQEAVTLRGEDQWWSYDFGPAPRLSKALYDFRVELAHP